MTIAVKKVRERWISMRRRRIEIPATLYRCKEDEHISIDNRNRVGGYEKGRDYEVWIVRRY